MVVAEQVIAATSINDSPIFHIPPNAGSVGIAAQQALALNLVSALAASSRISGLDQVAVVGSGPTALTLSAALTGFGCAVDMFTNGIDLLPARHAAHRFAHPTINRWPAVELSMTTRLPFLDWYAGDLSTVMRTIEEQGREILSAINLDTTRRVRAISQLAGDMVRIGLEPGGDGAERAYHRVILADDFGEPGDRKSGGRSYWEADTLERGVEGGSEIVIDRPTEGGLLDALRASHREFMGGALAVDVAAELAGSEIAEFLADAEAASPYYGGVSLSSRIYRSAVRRLNPALRDRLRDSLNPRVSVTLHDPGFSDPFAQGASPIHKLLVAHAIDEGTIRCLRSDLSTWPDTRALRPSATFRHAEMEESEFHDLLPDRQPGTNRPNEFQRWSALYDASWDRPYPVPPRLPIPELTNRAFLASRAPLAEKLLLNACGFGMDVTETGFEAYPLPNSPFDPVRLPTHLFGIPLLVRTEGPVAFALDREDVSMAGISAEIAKGWEGVPAAQIALSLLDQFTRFDQDLLDRMTLPMLLALTAREAPDREFLAAMAILVSSGVHVLDAHAIVIEGQEVIDLSAGELAERRRRGVSAGSVTEAAEAALEARTFLYFRASDRLREALANA